MQDRDKMNQEEIVDVFLKGSFCDICKTPVKKGKQYCKRCEENLKNLRKHSGQG
jgi:predicted amidophosphoribosyltransferase